MICPAMHRLSLTNQWCGNSWGIYSSQESRPVAGQREQLIGALQERYSYEKEQAEKELNEFTKGLKALAAKVEKVQPL